MRRLLDVTLFLSKQNLAFRAHREKGGKGTESENEGNFIELVKFLSKYDPIMKSHLDLSNKNEKYLSPVIQNDLILAFANCTSNQIVNDVSNAKYFSLILDGTIDISRTEQCSISVRYVNTEGTPEERFISFEKLEGAGAEDYFNVLTNKLKELDLQGSVLRRGIKYAGEIDRITGKGEGIGGRNCRLCTLLCSCLCTLLCPCFKPNSLLYCDGNIQ